MSLPKVFVTGATGAQGGSVSRAALKRKWPVNAIVRDPMSAASVALEAQGAKIFAGDWDNLAALEKAMAGCTVAFINVYPSFEDAGAEVRHAQNILKVAKSSGIKHVIYSSVAGINSYGKSINPDPQSFLGNYYHSKTTIEKAVSTGGWDTWTILRGAVFMTNFLQPAASFMYPELGAEGKLITALLPETKLWLLDPEDIGSFATAAFRDSQTFNGKKIEIASEYLTTQEIASCMEKESGKKLKVHFRTEKEIEAQQGHPIVESQVLMRKMSYLVNNEDIKAFGLPLTSFEEFLVNNKELLQKSIGPA